MSVARLLDRPTKHVVLTFDAFGTLYSPRQPIAQTYADVANKHGVTGASVDGIDFNFRKGA